jgi:predicted esterase
MINPDDRIGDMVLTIGQGENLPEIWIFCDPYVTEPGVFTKECSVPAQSMIIGYGSPASTVEQLDADWAASTWTLFLDSQPVNLPAFGTFDQEDDESNILRLWNVVLEQPAPGVHTLHYVSNESGKVYDVTWTFTVMDTQTYPALSSPVSLGQHPYTSQSTGLNFLLYLPNEYGKEPQKEWPLILYLHGWGERGVDIEALKRQPLPETLEQQTDFPFITISPQMPPEQESWSELIDSLNSLLDEIESTCSVDSQHIYLTGISMGGAGTWQFALKVPQRFAALVPVAGYYLEENYTVPDSLCDLREVPVWAFHGDRDSTVPPIGVGILVEAFKACGGDVQYTLYPGADHEETWRKAYADPELYLWLQSQTLR